MQLDLEAMRKAASQIIGEHDFVAFKASGSDAKNTVRRVLECGWNESGPMLRFSVKATGFLRYMVRGLVGTMVEIGLGKRPPEDLLQVIESRERSLAGPTAPARGLFLARVFYPPEFSLELGEEGCCGWMEHLVGLKAASPSGL
jgi:tRNA pseudouridine38-40 synthase